MANIEDLNEPWAGHSGLEVETFIKGRITAALAAADGKFGAVTYNPQSMSMVFYDRDGGTVLATIQLSGDIYTIDLHSNLPNVFYVLADETTKIMTIAPTTSKSAFGSQTSQDFPEAYTYIVSVNTGSGYVPRAQGSIGVGGSASVDLRPFLATGDNYIRVSVTGLTSQQTSTSVFTGTLTSLTLSVNHSWQTPWREGQPYTITGIRFAGNLAKQLHVTLDDVEVPGSPVSYTASQSYTTTATSFTIPASAFPAGGGVHSIKLWMSAQGVNTQVVSYNIICEAEGQTTPMVAINKITDRAYNFTSGVIFAFTVFNANRVSIDLSATLNSVNYPIAVDVPQVGLEPGVQYQFAYALEVDTGANETQIGSLGIAVTAYQDNVEGNTATGSTIFDNTYSYLATPGYLFYLNAATRNNGAANYQTIVNEAGASEYFLAEYPATWTGLSWQGDGWDADKNGNNALVIPAGASCAVPDLTPLELMSAFDGLTIEMMLQCGSPSDYSAPVFSIATAGENPYGILIYPTKIVVWSSMERDEDYQTVNFSENAMTHICVTFVKGYEGNAGKNVCSVYVNGISNVCFEFDGSANFGNAPLVIGQPNTDAYLYRMRIYGSALEARAVFNNFLNSIVDATAFNRQELAAENDILLGESIDYDLCKRVGLNTMVVITPIDPQTGKNIPIPSFFNNRTVDGTTVRFEYAGASNKNVTVGNVAMDGQGTTSKKYFRWNLRWKTGDSTTWLYGDGSSDPDGKTGRMINDESYVQVDRITAKKNIASSPQGHKMGLTGLYNDLFHQLGLNQELPDPDYRVAVYQFPFVGFQYNSVNDTYEFIGMYTAGPDKGSKVTFGYLKKSYPDALSIEGPNHNPRGTRFLHPWVDVTYDPSEETLCFGGQEGWDCDYVKYETSTKGTQADWDAILALYEDEWRPAYNCVYDNSPYLASAAEVIRDLNNGSITTLSALLDPANAGVVKAGVTNGMAVANEYIAFYDTSYDLYFFRRSTGAFEKLPNDYVGYKNALTDLSTYLSAIGASTSAPTTAELIAARAARFKATVGNFFSVEQTLYHFCFCLLYGVTDNFAKNSYPFIFKRLDAAGPGNRWGWRQDDLDSVLMTDNNGTNTKKYSVEVMDLSEDDNLLFQGGDSALWKLVTDYYGDECRTMMERIANAAAALATALRIAGSGVQESLFNLTKYYCWDHSAQYFPATVYESDRRWSYIEPWLLAGTPRPGSGETYPATYNGVAPLRQAVGDQFQGEKLWMERRIAYICSKYRIGPFKGDNAGYGMFAFTLAEPFTFYLTPAIDLYPVVSIGPDDSAAGRTPAGTPSSGIYVGTTGNTTNYLHGLAWLASMGDLSGMRLTSRGGSTSIDFIVTGDRLQALKIGDAVAGNVRFNATRFGISSPTLVSLDARNTATITNNVDLLNCPRLRSCLFAGSGAVGLLLPVGAKLTEVSFPEAAEMVFMHSLPFLQLANLSLPNLAGITALYINNCAHINPFFILAAIVSTTGESLEYITLIWRGAMPITQEQAEALVEIADRAGYVDYTDGAVSTKSGTPDIEGTITPATKITAQAADLLEETFGEGLVLEAADSQLYIEFEDANVESVCLGVYDSNSDGLIELNEAKAVTNLGERFKNNTSIVTFNELKYFTSLTYIYGNSSTGTFFGCSNLEEVTLPSTVREIVRYAFYNTPKLSKINLENVTTLGTYAFGNTGIIELNMPNLTSIAAECFYNSKSLVRIVSLGRITTIPHASSSGYGVFRGCSALQSVVLPETITLIGNYTFANLAALTTINFPSSLTTIGAGAFMSSGITNELSLPGITSLGNQAFRGSKITKILSLGQMTSIVGGTASGDGVFRECTSLTSVVLPNTLTSLGGSCFMSCSNLVEVTLPNGPHSISGSAFRACSKLESVVNLDKVTAMGAMVFYGCTKLAIDVNLPNLTSMLDACFYGSGIVSISSLGSITTIPGGTSSGTGSFRECTKLVSAVLPSTLTSIGGMVFYGDTALVTINLPSSLTVIGYAAFAGCSKLVGEFSLPNIVTLTNTTNNTGGCFYNTRITKMDIGPNCTTIGGYCFRNCSALATLIVRATTPPSLGTNALQSTPSTQKIYVPDASVDTYKAATNWSSVASRITPLSQLPE